MRAGHGLFEALAGDRIDAAIGGGGDNLVAALAQNGDGLRADQAGPPMTTIFIVYPRLSTSESCSLKLQPCARSGYVSEPNWNSRDACLDRGARTIRATTYATYSQIIELYTRSSATGRRIGVFC